MKNERRNMPFFVICSLAIFVLTGCDPQRKKQCEWYFIPFPEGNPSVEEGWVSICVANFKLGRQRCYFTAKPNFLDKMNGIPFRYTSLKYTDTFPKKVISVKPCRGH
ncbi:hypothetical protein [Pseudobacteriovorax antillogorgiicola]|uniref:hypothetical protein n=1 Tax=Pseudobacteriovorax antillogorgiicola TaxID=1513793 RepID=UPI001042DF6E|nr:hypothetical protein [Pseudobacteriovorax antillogorgiicola]